MSMTSSNYTDADVARMLGWHVGPIGYHAPGNYQESFNCIFGLSTPPSPEADANAARFVLPWLMDQGYSVLIKLANEYASEYLPACFCVQITDEERKRFITKVGDTFGPTICTAALEATNAE